MMTERKFREQEVQIARYRVLERDVTDPLAASLLHIIILELEADLQKRRCNSPLPSRRRGDRMRRAMFEPARASAASQETCREGDDLLFRRRNQSHTA
jgi:hypothetical protein